MPPPRRRRPVQPATRVRIPRPARSRGTPAAESPNGGRPPVAEAPGTGLAPGDLTRDDPVRDDPVHDLAGDEALRDKPAGDDPVRDLAGDEALRDKPAGDELARDDPVQDDVTGDEPAGEGQAPAAGEQGAGPLSRHPLALPACLGALAVILGGLAVWFGLEASSATSGVDASNTALTEPAATRQVTQQVTSAVDKIFSYNYADTARTGQAAAAVLTGKARQQYSTLFKLVRRDAPKEKLILTTTVTDSGVEFLDGSQARLLIFADQRDTAGALHKTTAAGAMFAVNAVKQGGRWKITNIDTFGAGG
jgi:Mce-associated membrane protein